VFTPYPFQVNTHGLPPEVIRDCLVGFIKTVLADQPEAGEPDNFHDWVLHVFGEGFAKNFFFPFNKKFFKTDLREITREWAGWSVPRPELHDVIEGALGISKKSFGYNAEFHYPAEGIEQLPRALAAELSAPVETGLELVEVLLDDKVATLSNGDEVRYDKLVSTIPLERLVSMAVDAPDEIKDAARGLRVLSVLCANLGVDAELNVDDHWIYVPEPKFDFHRIGVYSNFMPSEPKKSSLYLEFTLPGPRAGAEGTEERRLIEDGIGALEGLSLWEGGQGRIEEALALMIEHGYVIHDRHRAEWLPRIAEFLRGKGVVLAGRYARWEYSTMEDAIRQGREVAEGIIKE